MRIAYITNTYARASDTFIRNEVVELRRRGHDVTTFSIRRPEADHRVSADVAAEQASTCYILSVPKATLLLALVGMACRRPLRVARALALAMRISPPGIRPRTMNVFYWAEAIFLASRLLALRIEILHNHIAENSATVAMLASAISGVPFSMTVHGPGIFFHPKFWALREKIHRATFTACITEFCKSQCMLHSTMADWPTLHVVRCGVGREFEQAAQVSVPQAPRLLFVGRLCEEKGLPLLLEAVAMQVAAGRPCRLAIIGDGPLMGHVRTFVEQHAMTNAIELLGWRGSADIVRELQASRALVLPSFAEGLPVVIMEAMALGRPVVTTAVAGIPELVRAGENGWLVPAGSIDDLATAIGELVTADPETLDAMGRHGARLVRQKHSLDREVDKLEALLKAASVRQPGTSRSEDQGRARNVVRAVVP